MAKMTEKEIIQALGNTDKAYQIGVIENLRTLGGDRGDVVVRFGLTGVGQTPHYQIEVMMDDGAHTFNGKNHAPCTGAQTFNKGNISKRRFSLKEMIRIFSGQD